MVRLVDIAKRAHTSIATVSIVLSSRPSNVVISESTRQAVLDAARELGYAPDIAARRLRRNGGGPRTIVLAIAHPVDGRLSLVSRIVAGVQRQLHAMQEELAAAGVVQLIVETFELGSLDQLRGLSEPFWFNGLLITNTAPEDDAYLDSLTPSVPIVLFQRYTRHSSVNTDSELVGRLVTQHLIDLGHHRIGLICPDVESQALTLRTRGYRETLRRAGLPGGLEAVAYGRNWADGAYAATQRLLSPADGGRPTAIFAANDLLAIGAMRAIRDWGLRVPEDVAIAGCDDAEFAAYLEPALTTVHLPIEEMAARATAILLDLIRQRATPPVQEMLPAHLVVRRSSGPPGAPGAE
ncbi:MAG: LacI family transcriptional regulator [Chloroflexi bacterium]|nr:LacI family transcriptional regulator [Chloroflexota bacterium]